MEKYFRVEFTAQLTRFNIAFKHESHIEKISQSGKIPMISGSVNFNNSLSIYCNMVFDVEGKVFREKIIILYTEKGDKKLGQIKFDVSTYLNERNKTPKEYNIPLQMCPDKNSKLLFKLSSKIEKQIAADTISHNSIGTVNVQKLIAARNNNQQQNKQPPKSGNESNRDVYMVKKDEKIKKVQNSQPISSKNISQQNEGIQKNNQLQNEIQRLKALIKNKQKLKKQNEQLKRKIKAQQFQSVKPIKQKIQAGKKQIQKYTGNINKTGNIQKQISALKDDISKYSMQVMNAFNLANQIGGGKLMNAMQEACGK